MARGRALGCLVKILQCMHTGCHRQDGNFLIYGLYLAVDGKNKYIFIDPDVPGAIYGHLISKEEEVVVVVLLEKVPARMFVFQFSLYRFTGRHV